MKILIVEDEKLLADSLKAMLEKRISRWKWPSTGLQARSTPYLGSMTC